MYTFTADYAHPHAETHKQTHYTFLAFPHSLSLSFSLSLSLCLARHMYACLRRCVRACAHTPCISVCMCLCSCWGGLSGPPFRSGYVECRTSKYPMHVDVGVINETQAKPWPFLTFEEITCTPWIPLTRTYWHYISVWCIEPMDMQTHY
jgi:hypothetical protein